MEQDRIPFILILLGPPGSGKGSQASFLKDRLRLPHVSTGELFRENIRHKTSLGIRAKGFIDQGKLVPDELVTDMLFTRISEQDCKGGYILDGFPRTLPQAESLDKRLAHHRVLFLVIYMGISDIHIVQRLTNRFTCSNCQRPYHLLFSPPQIEGRCDHCQAPLIHRDDDREEVVKKRLQVYHKETTPLIDYYSQKRVLHSVDASMQKERVSQEILNIIEVASFSR